jgi:hypothetical protein
MLHQKITPFSDSRPYSLSLSPSLSLSIPNAAHVTLDIPIVCSHSLHGNPAYVYNVPTHVTLCHVVYYFDHPSNGTRAQIGPWPFFLTFLILSLTHAIRLLWTCYQPDAKASTYTREHNTHTPSGIRTDDPSNEAANTP